jgi:hypothetical protein
MSPPTSRQGALGRLPEPALCPQTTGKSNPFFGPLTHLESVPAELEKAINPYDALATTSYWCVPAGHDSGSNPFEAPV